MGAALARALINKPKYYVGMQGLAMRERGVEIESFLKERTQLTINDFFPADILHTASIKGQLNLFFAALKTRKEIILVAPDYLRKIKNKIDYKHFVSVPVSNCWTESERIVSEIKVLITEFDNPIVLFVASMPANIMVDTLHKDVGQKVSLLDIGSVLDPYAGKHTRTYHNKIIIQ